MRWIALLCSWIFLVIGLVAPAAADDLRLAVALGPVSLPIYVAQANGYFRAEGVGLVITDCASGRSCFQEQLLGRADMATATELMVVMDSFTSPEAVILASISSSTRHIKLIARRSAGVNSPEGLRGKKIGTVAGTSAEYFLDSWLLFHDIDPADVRVVSMAPQQLADALRRRDIDAVAIWEPEASAAIAALGNDLTVLPNAKVYDQHFCLTAKHGLSYARQGEIIKILRALDRAERFIAEQPSAAAMIGKARLADSKNMGSLDEHVFKLSLNQSLVSTMDGQARWARRRGLVPASGPSPNMLSHIEPALLRLVQNTAVTLAH